jgi:uncharacterized phage protein gp47/JayE
MAADFSPYVNMRLYDKQPSDIYLNALELAQLNIPQFELRVGTVEDAIFQAMAYMTSLSVTHINALPNRLMEGILSMMGVPRLQGSNATVTVDVELATYSGATITEGTTFVHETSIFGEITQTYYQVVGAVTIPDVVQDPEAVPATPLPTAAVQIMAMDVGSVPTVVEGDSLTILNINSQVSSVIAGADFVQGEDTEGDGEYLARGVTALSSLSDALVTANQIEKYIASTYPAVKRVKAYDLTDSDLDSDVGAAPAPGYATAYVYGNNTDINILERLQIQKDVNDKTSAGLAVKITPSRIISASISASVEVPSTYSVASASTSVNTALKSYLNPLYFPYTETSIRANSIVGLLSKLPSVLYVSDVQVSSNDMDIDAETGNLLFQQKGDLPSLAEEAITLTINVGDI